MRVTIPKSFNMPLMGRKETVVMLFRRREVLRTNIFVRLAETRQVGTEREQGFKEMIYAESLLSVQGE